MNSKQLLETKATNHLKFTLLTLCLLSSLLPLLEAAELPDNDIVLFQLHHQDGQFSVSDPVIVADSPEYDNQPRFSPDGELLYFTHMDSTGANIWLWTPGEKAKLLIPSPLSEYSPTPIPTMPGSLSTVRVEADNSQRLWKYDDKEGFSLLFTDIKPVGYHAWSGTNLALFVLGEPHQLQVTHLGETQAKVVDKKVGRCLQTAPSGNAITYTAESETGWQVKVYDFDAQKSKVLIQLPSGGEDYVWYDDTHLIASDGKQLLVGAIDSKLGWQTIVNQTKFEVSGISRLALSPDKSQIAVVYSKKPTEDDDKK